MTNPSTGSNSRTSRIPATLQAVFLASNRGNEVNTPPPNQAGNKVFRSNWFFQRKSSKNSNNSRNNNNNNNNNSNKRDTRSRSATKPATAATKADTSIPKQPQPPQQHVVSPQVYLDTLLRSRGYSTQRVPTLQTSYHKTPTHLQVASYSVYMIGLVRNSDAATLERILASGISPNPCNSYGESLLHHVCRKGNTQLLDLFLKNGCSLAVCDDYGRTPLHDACWRAEPAFELVQMILDRNVRMFHMIDARERLPLDYVREEDWPGWIDFLDHHKDIYWPTRSKEQGEEAPLRLTTILPNGVNTRSPLPDPHNALSLEMAQLVASGRMTPEEVGQLLLNKTSGDDDDDEDATLETTRDVDASYSSNDDDNDDDDSDYYDSDDDDDDYSVEFDDDMETLLQEMSNLRAQKVAVGS